MKRFIALAVSFLFLTFASAVIAGETTITFEWDLHNQSDQVDHFELYESDQSGGPWPTDNIVVDDIAPGTRITVDYQSTKPDGVATQSYFILKAVAVGTDSVQRRSGPSNEVDFLYDYAPIVAPENFAALVNGDDIEFSWTQGDIARVAKWQLFSSETSGQDYTMLSEIEYTGQPGPQYGTVETMTVAEGEVKTFYFVLVSFNSFGVFSQNSTEVSVTIDKSTPEPVYNFRIRVTTQ